MIDIHNRQGFCEMIAGALGVVMLASPWVLGFWDNPAAAWNASIVGILLAVTAALPFVTHDQWSSIFTGMLAVWSIAAVWVLGFAHEPLATWTHLVIGVALLVLAGTAQWFGLGAHDRELQV
jgi:hypothetical protein